MGSSAPNRVKLGLCHCLNTLRQRAPFLPLGGLLVPQIGNGDIPLKVPIRLHSDDWITFLQVFVEHEYDWPPLRTPRRIVDLRANCGFATLALARRFPDAHIVAVEPHPDNAAALHRTVECNRLPAEVIEAAIFATDGAASLHLSRRTVGHSLRADGRLVGRAAIKVPAISMPTVMKRAGWSGVDLLKIDIEGYEQNLFEDSPPWLRYVDTIVGELHGAYDCDRLAADLGPCGFQIEGRAKSRNHLFYAHR